MKRVAQLLLVIAIIGGHAFHSLAKDGENQFDGFWKAEGGSVVRIYGTEGVLVYTPVKSWKVYVDKTVIRNIRQRDNKWIVDEFISPSGEGVWTEVEWELDGNRISRRVMFEGKLTESYYKKPGLHKPHNIELGFMYYYFDYEEDVPAPFKSTEEEWLPGFYLGYAYSKKNDPFTKLFVEYTQADTDYDGTTQAGVPVKDTTENIFFRFEWDVGYAFDAGKRSSFTPYVGYGYRYWERGLQGPAPFDERYTWHYVPVGIRADIELNDTWNIGANVAARIMFEGKMRAFLSQIDSSASDFRVDLGNKTGWFAEVPIRCHFSGPWSFTVTPWYEYSEIGKSDEVNIIYVGGLIARAYEPASTTHQYGVNAGLVYSF